MATTRRNFPYIWPTWLVGFLAGKSQCRFSPWYKAHFKYEKRQDDSFDLAAWSADHNRLVEQVVQDLRADGWTVHVEEENKFTLKGQSALLGGKPDIIATKVIRRVHPGKKPDTVTTIVRVVDAKTGKVKDADWWQVLLYMLAWRLNEGAEAKKAQREVVDAQVEGVVFYPGNPIVVKPEELTKQNEQRIYETIRWVAGDEQPPTTPSVFECRGCDIADCRDRMTEEAAAANVDVF